MRSAIYALCFLFMVAGGCLGWWNYRLGGTGAKGSDARSAGASSTSSEFEAVVTSTGKEFEKLFAEARASMLRSSANKPNVEKFKGLVQKIKTAQSFDQIDETLKEIDLLILPILEELYVPSNERLVETVKQLDAVACRPKALAKNADEGFRADRFGDPLRNQAYQFQDQVGQVIGVHLQERSDLATSLRTAVVDQAHRLPTKALDLDDYQKWVHTDKLSKSIEKKFTQD